MPARKYCARRPNERLEVTVLVRRPAGEGIAAAVRRHWRRENRSCAFKP